MVIAGRNRRRLCFALNRTYAPSFDSLVCGTHDPDGASEGAKAMPRGLFVFLHSRTFEQPTLF